MLGGFTSAIRIFMHGGQPLTNRQVSGMRMILEHTFATVGCAIFPLLLLYSSVPEWIVWRATSLVLAAFFAFEIWIQSYRIKKAVTDNKPSHPKLLRYHFFPCTSLFLLLQLLNLLFWGSFTAIVWALFWLLNPPCIQLYLSFFHSEPKNGQSSKEA